VDGLLKEGDETGYQGRTAEDFYQQGNNCCDCHDSPFFEIWIAANHWPLLLKNVTESLELLIKDSRKIAFPSVTSPI